MEWFWSARNRRVTNYVMFEKNIWKVNVFLFEVKSSCMNFQNMSFTIVFLTGTIFTKGALERFFSSMCSNMPLEILTCLHNSMTIRTFKLQVKMPKLVFISKVTKFNISQVTKFKIFPNFQKHYVSLEHVLARQIFGNSWLRKLNIWMVFHQYG